MCGGDVVGIVARFKLHLRCDNCAREVAKVIEVPDVEDAPRDVEELLESEFLRRQFVHCRCGGVMMGLVAVMHEDPA